MWGEIFHRNHSTVQYIYTVSILFQDIDKINGIHSYLFLDFPTFLASCSTWRAGRQNGLLSKIQYFNILNQRKEAMCISAAYGQTKSHSSA